MHERQKWIARWREQNALSAARIPDALRLAGIPPAPWEWRLWIDRLLLWLGVSALLAGLIFFVAANWSGIGRFGKFALVEAILVASLVAYALGARFRYGNAALLAASLAVGALLALIGQTYQTGADTYELFLLWALLIVPWALAARLPALWVLWLTLLHVAYGFYVQTLGRSWNFEVIMTAVVLFDCGVLALWECVAARGLAWMQGRWMPRLLALTAGIAVTVLAIYMIFEEHRTTGPYFVLYLLVLGGLYGGYRHKMPDLFMLAGGALSLIVVATTWLAQNLLKHGDAFFILGVFSMLATAGAAWWLRQVAREFKDNENAQAAQDNTDSHAEDSP